MQKLLKLMMNDNALHFLWCFFLTALGWRLGGFIGIPFGWIAGPAFAIGKEVLDWFNYGKDINGMVFTRMVLADLLFDGIGIGLAYLIIRGI